jgi:RNA polymerase sigma factor (TIGR02999 family)
MSEPPPTGSQPAHGPPHDRIDGQPRGQPDDEQREEVTRLLREAQQGEAGAGARLLPLVYERLRELAGRRMAAERAGHTLQATALVHEAYLRLVGGGGADAVPWADRSHFFFAAAEAMRRILVDHARARAGPRRGGGRGRVPLSSVVDLAAAAENPAEILAVDEAFSRLQVVSDSAAAVARLRFFAGLGTEEIAQALGVSPRTVRRELTYARAWLARELRAEPE